MVALLVLDLAALTLNEPLLIRNTFFRLPRSPPSITGRLNFWLSQGFELRLKLSIVIVCVRDRVKVRSELIEIDLVWSEFDLIGFNHGGS